MLVLSRKELERIVVDERIIVTVVKLKSNRVSIGVDAPKDMAVRRGEVPPKERSAA